MRIGIRLESLGLSLRSALPQAARMGVKGVQLDAVGDLSAERLGDTARRELRNLLKSFDLSLTAINCPLRHGIDVAENQDARLEHVRNTLNLAFELGPRLVVVQCPRLPDETDPPRAQRLREALLDLGRHGDRGGSSLALEIGFDTGEKVRDYLAALDVGSLGVNYDPANLMLHGHDPLKNLIPLKGRLLHVQARDARVNSVSQAAAEVPLGAGDIDWLGFAGTLDAVDYRAWVVVRRDTGGNRAEDVAAGVKLLRRMVI